jgi:hypothetical protein
MYLLENFNHQEIGEMNMSEITSRTILHTKGIHQRNTKTFDFGIL